MLNNIDVTNWSPYKVRDWLVGVCDDSSWLDLDKIIKSNIGGKRLLNMTCQDIEDLGASKVSEQEEVLEAIEKLRDYNFKLIRETLQSRILELSCRSRTLSRQLYCDRMRPIESPLSSESPQSIILSSEFKYNNNINMQQEKQRVSLDTLVSVSDIVTLVHSIIDILNSQPFCRKAEFRSTKGLFITFSVMLTSTAQRDQFVDGPNDIIEDCTKKLADYCDKIVSVTEDPLLIQPYQIETVRIKKDQNNSDLGLKVKSADVGSLHLIETITPLSPAKKTNKLDEGDEIIQFNQNIVGWTAKSVEELIKGSSNMSDIVLMVKKSPTNKD